MPEKGPSSGQRATQSGPRALSDVQTHEAGLTWTQRRSRNPKTEASPVQALRAPPAEPPSRVKIRCRGVRGVWSCRRAVQRETLPRWPEASQVPAEKRVPRGAVDGSDERLGGRELMRGPFLGKRKAGSAEDTPMGLKTEGPLDVQAFHASQVTGHPGWAGAAGSLGPGARKSPGPKWDTRWKWAHGTREQTIPEGPGLYLRVQWCLRQARGRGPLCRRPTWAQASGLQEPPPLLHPVTLLHHPHLPPGNSKPSGAAGTMTPFRYTIVVPWTWKASLPPAFRVLTSQFHGSGFQGCRAPSGFSTLTAPKCPIHPLSSRAVTSYQDCYIPNVSFSAFPSL